MEHALRLPRFPGIGDIIRWVFGEATVLTLKGKAKISKQLTIDTAGTGAAPPKYIAMGVGAHGGGGREAKNTDTGLTTEVESRTIGTMSVLQTTNPEDTWQLQGTITATATREVDECGIFDASTAGNMFLSSTIKTDSLNSGDSSTFTFKVQEV